MIAILVFFSGFTALVYELLWVKTLTLIFGTTIYAVSTVLTAFFAGIALGNYLFGRLSDTSRNPLLLYGILELAIGISALLYPFTLGWVSSIYLSIGSTTEPSFITLLYRFFLGMIVILPPATFMGGTLPVIVRYLAGKRGEVAGSLAILYSVNTAGAVLGTLIAGFFLIGHFGVGVSMVIAAMMNIAIAILVFLMSDRGMHPVIKNAGAPSRSPEEDGRKEEAALGKLHGVILTVAAISGFASIAYEVAWTRMLIHYSGTTTYAFTTILVTFLTGIAAGGYISRWTMRGRMDLWIVLAIVEIGIGVSALVSTFVMDNLALIDSYLTALLASSQPGIWQNGLAISLLKNATVMFFPTLFMGISLPVAIGIIEDGATAAGKTVGNLFSVNTLGAIIGSFAAGFVLIPLAGTGWTIAILVAVNISLSLILLIFNPGKRRRTNALIIPGILVLFLVTLLPHKDLFRNIYPKERLLFFTEGSSSTVAVVKDEDSLNPEYLRMFVDGNGLSGTDYSGRRYMKLLGHLPAILSGGTPENALVICLGTGMTMGAVSCYPSVRKIDCVEISREVVDAAGYFSEANRHSLEDKRVNIIIDDGRNFLLTTGHRYDLITLEPPPPRSAGVVNLYSKEFYLHARDHLQPDGVICQWIPLHDQSEGDIKALIRTFLDVFPHVTCWLIERNELALIGSMTEPSIDLTRWQSLLEVPEIAEDLASIDILDLYDLLSLYFMDERGLSEYVGQGNLITDDRPVIEFFLFQWGNSTYRYSPHVREAYLPVLERMKIFWSDARSLIRNGGDLRGKQFYDHKIAIRHFVDGTILRNRGQEEDAKREFLLAVESVGDNGYYRHYLGISDLQRFEALRRAQEDPANLAVKSRLGYIYFLENNLDEAHRYFMDVVHRDPSNMEARINLGMVQEEMGDLEGAKKNYTLVMKNSGGELANLLLARLEGISAIESVMTGSEPSRIHEVALMFWRMKRYSRAVKWFGRAVDTAPGWELPHYNLAATYEAMRRYQEALVSYEKSYKISGSIEAANNIEKLRLFLSIERDGGGSVVLMDGDKIQVSWEDPRSHNYLGIRFYRNGEYIEAIAAFMRAHEEDPDYAEPLINAGDSYREMGDYDAALSLYKRVKSIDPKLGEPVDGRIRSLEKRISVVE